MFASHTATVEKEGQKERRNQSATSVTDRDSAVYCNLDMTNSDTAEYETMSSDKRSSHENI